VVALLARALTLKLTRTEMAQVAPPAKVLTSRLTLKHQRCVRRRSRWMLSRSEIKPVTEELACSCVSRIDPTRASYFIII
jgi:hypothetical protein